MSYLRAGTAGCVDNAVTANDEGAPKLPHLDNSVCVSFCRMGGVEGFGVAARFVCVDCVSHFLPLCLLILCCR